jgi:hypothetical protein
MGDAFKTCSQGLVAGDKEELDNGEIDLFGLSMLSDITILPASVSWILGFSFAIRFFNLKGSGLTLVFIDELAQQSCRLRDGKKIKLFSGMLHA